MRTLAKEMQIVAEMAQNKNTGVVQVGVDQANHKAILLIKKEKD